MKVLIIGGNRFVGAEVVSRAVLDGHEVTVVALDPPNIRARSHVRFVKADRNKPDELLAGLKGHEFDAVLDNIAFVPSNVEILLEVLKGRVGRYVLTSTVDIYPREVSCISSEKHKKLSPSDLKNHPHGERYFRGKRGCEKVLRKSGILWSIIRPAIVFGRSDPIPPAPRIFRGINIRYGRSLFFPSRVVDGGPILLRRTDRRVFRLASSQDVATALLLVAHHPDAVGKAFNVAGDEVWTSERLIHALCEAAGTTSNIVRVSDEELESAGLGDYDSPYGRVKWWSVVDNRRLKSLGWSPTPASVQLAKLVEAVPSPSERPFYDRRMQEIALAERCLRQQRTWIVYQGAVRSEPPGCGSVGENSSSLPVMEGRFSGEAADVWRNNLIRSYVATPIPHKDHFREFIGRPVSSIGIGTHRGDASAETDDLYRESLLCAVRGGINLIDTAINYRWMRSERTIREVVAGLDADGISRKAICLCSKGGFVPQDADDPRPVQEYIWDEFVVPGLIDMNEAVRRHSIKAGFVRKLLTMSLLNLGMKHIDVYLLHNPERAMAWMGPEKFYDCLRQTFFMLEDAVSAGSIGSYGIATWQGLRTSPKNEYYLSLERIFSIARDVGGPEHHFRAIQFPLNCTNTEALLRTNQEIGGKKMTVLEAASRLGLYIFTSASISRGQDLSPEIAERLTAGAGGQNTIQAALNFVRSVPGVGTALVGMRKRDHVEKALIMASYPLMSPDEVQKIYG